MADIFGYNRSGASGVFVADKSTLKIDGVDGVDMVQNWSVQYTQTLNPIYEVGSSRIFWAKGNPSGQGSIGRIIGRTFLKMSSNICDTGCTLTIKNSTGCSDVAGQVKLKCGGAVCTSVGFSAQAGTPTIMQNVTFQFASLDM